MEIKIYGASDDLVEICGDIEEEFDVYDEPCKLLINEKVRVDVEYENSGCWSIKMFQSEEDYAIPSFWDISLSQHPNGYSALLTINSGDTDLKVTKIE